MNRKQTLYISQYGDKFSTSSVRELRKKIGNGSSRVSKMYVDGTDGKTYHVGYIVGKHWLTAYTPMRNLA